MSGGGGGDASNAEGEGTGSSTTPARGAANATVGGANATVVVAANATFTYTEAFEDPLAAPNATYRDEDGFRCTHELRAQSGAPYVAGEGDASEGDLGFTTYYVDSLGANGSAPLHSSAGAYIGVERAVDSTYAYALRASGTDGYLFVCSKPVRLSAAASVCAEARVYVTDAGWHEDVDELRIWADLGVGGQISLLPGCNDTATRANIDVLGLRGNWSTLAAELGELDSTNEARVCVGLQSGAGAETVYVDSLKLVSGSDSAERCAASTGLTGVADFASLAVAGSCDGSSDATARTGGQVALIVICVLVGAGAIAFLVWTILNKPKPAQLSEVTMRTVS